MPGADCGTDHELLTAKMRIKLRATKKTQRVKRYDIDKIPENYAVEISNKFANLPTVECTPNELWEEIKSSVKTAAENHIPKVLPKKKSPWISKEAMDIANQRRLAKAKGNNSENNRRNIKNLNAAFQRQIRNDKAEFLERLCTEIENESRAGRTRELFKKVNEINKKFTPRRCVIRQTDSTTQTEKDGIIQRWKEYTESIYKKEGQTEETYTPREYEKEPHIMESEIQTALKDISNSKSPGDDGIQIELLKASGQEGIKILLKLCNKIWDQLAWPQDWKQSVYIPLPKKGDLKECANWRTIALISHASKVLLKVIQRRLEKFMDEQLPPNQAGFRRGRGTRDIIADARWILENAHTFQQDIYMCFIDYSKAFDCVNHSKLWNTMQKMGAPEHIVNLLKELYYQQTAKVRTQCGDTEWFSIGKGVRQGCILSPYLFNIYSEQIIRNALEDQLEGIKIGGLNLNNLRYADDTTLIADGKESLISLISKVKEESEKFGLRLNVKKTKIMTNKEKQNIQINGEYIEVVEKFELLGAQISCDGSSRNEIRRRAAMARSAMAGLSTIWKDKNINLSLKKRLVSALIHPIFTYACESWTMNKKEWKIIDTFEMWCWRRMLQVSWTRHKTNRQVLQEVGTVLPLCSKVLKHQLAYFGHIIRASESLETRIMLGKTEGSRKRGRPRTNWIDGIKKNTGKTLHEMRRMAIERLKWRKFIWEVAKGRYRLDGTR